MSTKTLNHNALKWVEALESGEFQQGKYCLTSGSEHCCLGVACVVAMRNGVALDVEVVADGTHYGGQSATLPVQVRDWLGLRTHDSHFVTENNEKEQLTALNDKGATFAELAALIRSQPKGLFSEA